MTSNELANTILKNQFHGNLLIHLGDDTEHGVFYVYDEGGLWIEKGRKEIENVIDELDPDATNAKYSNTCKKLAIRSGGRDIEMNLRPDLINLKNGMYDPLRGELLPHAHDYYSTIQLSFKYDKKAVPLKWLSFLDQVFYKEEEKSQIPTLQEFMGYSFLPYSGYRKALVLHGVSASGKSTIEAIWIKMLGANTYTATGLKDISQPQNIYRFKNSLINFSDETKEGLMLEGDVFKQIIGGSTPIEGRQIYKAPVTFVPFTRMVVLTNHLPIIVDSSNATWNRLLLISLSHAIPEKERISNFEDTMIDELPAIFNWCMEGYKRLEVQQCFSESAYMKSLLKQYQTESDPIEIFILEKYAYMEVGFTEEETIRNLYSDYEDWFFKHEGNRKGLVSSRTFTRRVREKFTGEHPMFIFEDKRLTDGVRGFRITCIGKENYEEQGIEE